MKLPLSWLREWVEVPWSAAELAERLTLAGLEVEGRTSAAPPFTGVVVAKILEVTRHPQAERLQVCTVSRGGGAPLQIVCGAANARAGLVIALATVGAELPGDVEIKAAKLRGVESAGMLCSARELGLADTSEGILELPEELELGTDLRQALDLDDEILEISITPNRGDAMSVLGVAREIAALTGAPLRGPAIEPVRAVHARTLPVALEPGAGAARFAARLIDGADNTRESPWWLRERLRRAGLRSISPVVDITNYVLLELGQPMHAYDRARVHGGLQARRARAGESLRLLDGREVTLSNEVLVIADEGGAVGLAGVMGGERTALSAASRDIAFEVAWFQPDAIAGRARQYGLTTDASQRFERGVDPAGQERAIERATALLLAVAGGAPGPVTVAELRQELPQRPAVRLRAQRLQRLLGVAIESHEVERRLRALQMRIAAEGAGWNVQPPSWRFDIAIEADLIEEVARLGGLLSIPEHDPVRAVTLSTVPAQTAEYGVLETLAARGYREAISFGFVDPKVQSLLFPDQRAIELANPIASDLAVMRCSLWPGLIAAARTNLSRQQERVRLLEIATRFHADGGPGREEQKVLAMIALGTRLPEQWGVARTPIDFFDIKADLLAVLALSGRAHEFAFEPAALACLHPGRSARIVRAGTEVGWLGELHPEVVRSLDLTYAPILVEIDYVAATAVARPQFREISRFPQIRRDISFTVPESVTFSRIRERVSVAASSLLKELRLFDLYQGAEVESGRKSIALGLILQDLNRTLTDEDADRIIGAVIADLRTNLDARIRE
jgi:phenylalanyl-tRNA synthetase beta chain